MIGGYAGVHPVGDSGQHVISRHFPQLGDIGPSANTNKWVILRDAIRGEE